MTELLGSGQFGMVNKGVWQRVGGVTEVAIKTLREGATEEDKVRFLQEAATSGQFQHPNVVKLQGVVTVGEPVRLTLFVLLLSCPTTSIMLENYNNVRMFCLKIMIIHECYFCRL